MSKLLSDESAERCEAIAARLRTQLGLAARERLEPRNLAALLGIEVTDLPACAAKDPGEVCHLTEVDPTALSAVTIFRDGAYRIIVNPNHPFHSADESLRHELAHVLLGHPPKRLFDADCKRIWRNCEESQADYLACALAISTPELERMSLILEHDMVAVAKHFDVKVEIVAQRLGRPLPTAEQIPAAINEPFIDASGATALPTQTISSPPRGEGEGGTPAPAPSRSV